MNALKIIDKAVNGKKQNTITVDGTRYKINTHYLCWYAFEFKYDGWLDGRYGLEWFDSLYQNEYYTNGKIITRIPTDREKGLAELLKFYLKPFGGKDTGERVSEYDISDIWEPFFNLHEIDLADDEVHFHRFVAILHSLEEKGLVEKVIINADDVWKYLK